MEGGSFQVEVSPQMDIRLEGPVEPVFTGELSGRFLEALRKRPRAR